MLAPADAPAGPTLSGLGSPPSNGLGGPPLRTVDTQNRVCEFRDRIQRRPRRLPMRLVSRPRDQGHIDRTIALFPRELDLARGPILVIHTLQDRDRHADIGEEFGNIPGAEFRIEPGAVPAIEGVVDILVPA